MYYTVITEESFKGVRSHGRVVHNIGTGNLAKLLMVIYSGIDMDGSREKMRMVNMPSDLERDDSAWADHVSEDIVN